MRDSIMVLLGGSIVSVAIALWMALAGPGRKGARPRPETTRARRTVRRWELSGCILLAAAGLDVAASYGIGTSSSSAGSSVTVELGLAMMVLAVVWSIFRDEVLRYQLWLGAVLYGLPRPAEPAQVKAAEYIGTFLRLLLLLLGLITVVAGLILR
ncbi:hypothetical protein SAMN04487914_12326 [Arthrobacter sp. ok909]|jgi:hypothetical protein|uniref:hypothetical protein n=1 Tax=Arthrobacter sp. ok909 TaxID=1761746 RepID=UPI0008813F26|nr:hypothetical protein [Arthrobacter sp. ok909]SDP64890.1 hypothetical protein SAMN04487914_12326 [Arthrobacter sp. ok909]